MIAHEPEIESRDEAVRVVTRIEYGGGRSAGPEWLWVEYPAAQRPRPDGRADGVAAALLHLAMVRGESLEVRGPVCPRLLYGLEQYQEAFRVLFPGQFQRCTITARQAMPPPPPSEEPIVAQAFSGGVDSFHTLRWHRSGEPSAQGLTVTHALLVHGFDVALGAERSFAELASAYRPLLADLGVQLLTARTNFREVTAPVHWEISHGAALACVALSLGSALRAFLVSSTQAYGELIPWGSDPRFDHWLSTQRTELIHYGAHRSRPEKLLEIADWPPAQRGLHVCWEKPDGLANCCRCSKCLRTMAALKCAGQLAHYPTFPLPYERRRLRALIHGDDVVTHAARNLLHVARQRGDAEVIADVEHSLRRSAWHRRARFLREWLRQRVRQA